jgi:hypothetical protein
MILGFFITVSLLISLPIVGEAVSKKVGKNVYLGPEEKIEKSFIGAGETIEINAPIGNDLIVAGANIVISSAVQGDVLAAGAELRTKGKIEGNIRIAGGNLRIENEVEKNATLAGGIVILDENSVINGDVIVAGGNIELRGTIRGDVKGVGENIVLAGPIEGNVDLKLDSQEGKLTLLPGALIKGNLTYSAPEEADIKSGAEVLGEIFKKPIKEIPSRQLSKKIFGFGFLFLKLISLFGLLVVGLVIISLIPGVKVREITNQMMTKPLPSFGWGIIVLIISPVIFLLLFFTIIGIPLALIGLVLYFVSLYIAKVFVGIAVGQKLLEHSEKKISLTKSKKEQSLFWPMVLGMIIFVIITSIPFIGWLIKLVAVWWGLGAVCLVIKK